MSDVLTPEVFEFVLSNELKRAARSQNFVTLVLMDLKAPDPGALVEVARLVSRELRETDLLTINDATVSMVLLDADLENSSLVIGRVRLRLDHYQFTVPVDVTAGAACCPTDGVDIETLRRIANGARHTLTRRPPGTAQAR